MDHGESEGVAGKTSASLIILEPLTVRLTANWKILKEMAVMGVPNHLTSLLKNLYMGEEATVRTRRWKMDWLTVGTGVQQGCIL